MICGGRGMDKNSINDEEELYSLCIDMGWNLDWYNSYKENDNIYDLGGK